MRVFIKMRAAYLLSPSFITRGRMGQARQLSFWLKTLILIGHYSILFSIKTSKLRQERGGASLSFFQRSWSKPFPHVLSGHHPEPSGCTLGTLPGFLELLQNLYSQNQWIDDDWCVTSPDWGSTKTLPIGSPPSDKPCLACSIASESQVLFTQLILSM